MPMSVNISRAKPEKLRLTDPINRGGRSSERRLKSLQQLSVSTLDFSYSGSGSEAYQARNGSSMYENCVYKPPLLPA
jgi:hypothetical protein